MYGCINNLFCNQGTHINYCWLYAILIVFLYYIFFSEMGLDINEIICLVHVIGKVVDVYLFTLLGNLLASKPINFIAIP